MSERTYTWSEAIEEVAAQGYQRGYLYSHGPKRYRELEVAGIVTCAISKGNERTTWHLRLVEGDPPDFEVWSAEYPENVYKIENLQMPERDLRRGENITEQVYRHIITKKLNKPVDLSGDILCVYLRFNGRRFNFSDIFSKFHDSPPDCGRIWILAATNKTLTIWHCEEVWPCSQKQKIDFEEEFRKLGKVFTTKSVDA